MLKRSDLIAEITLSNMKKINILIPIIALLFSLNLNAQSIFSSCGYTVSISYNPVAIVPSSSSCLWGYNFNISFNYLITVQGINTCWNGSVILQPRITCSTLPNYFYGLNILAPTVGAPFSTTTYSGTITTTTNSWTALTNCATATPSSMGCTGCSYSASGPGIPNNNYACSFVAGLPIELVSFTGNCNSKSVSLNWTTASEINNDYFTIERAQDAINFKELRKFDGAANNNRTINYSFIDPEPLTGTSYYRLKQTDFDGQFNYFNTIAVTCQGKIGEIYIYPNPNNGSFIIEAAELNADITILNSLGEKIIHQKNSSKKTEFNLSYLSNGIYFIQMSSAKESVTRKFSINQ
tara:strand:+ start:391 stop:1446 length:1056 start_codon:yes stop_codon:yes gene_type:complete